LARGHFPFGNPGDLLAETRGFASRPHGRFALVEEFGRREMREKKQPKKRQAIK